MSRTVKILIGLAATLLMGWLWHGPLGNGEAFAAGLESQARAIVAETEIQGVNVSMERQPLSRTAVLSGPADEFQRNGMGSLPGLTDRVGGVDGMGAVRWADRPEQGGAALPLLAELLIIVALAYLVGLALGWLFWGRKPRERFAD